ncbi:YchJ family metal-binding protein [Pseudomonas aeruginosa]
MTQPSCPCGSGDPLDDCCGRYHQGHPAPTAEALMRSRYSAYALGLVDYLRDAPRCRRNRPALLDLDGIRAWSHWQHLGLGLEVENHEGARRPAGACASHLRRALARRRRGTCPSRMFRLRPAQFVAGTSRSDRGLKSSARNDPCPMRRRRL